MTVVRLRAPGREPPSSYIRAAILQNCATATAPTPRTSGASVKSKMVKKGFEGFHIRVYNLPGVSTSISAFRIVATYQT